MENDIKIYQNKRNEKKTICMCKLIKYGNYVTTIFKYYFSLFSEYELASVYYIGVGEFVIYFIFICSVLLWMCYGQVFEIKYLVRYKKFVHMFGHPNIASSVTHASRIFKVSHERGLR